MTERPSRDSTEASLQFEIQATAAGVQRCQVFVHRTQLERYQPFVGGSVRRLYRLAARVKALDSLKVAFKEGIKKSGLTLVLDEEKVGSASPPHVEQYTFSICFSAS